VHVNVFVCVCGGVCVDVCVCARVCVSVSFSGCICVPVHVCDLACARAWAWMFVGLTEAPPQQIDMTWELSMLKKVFARQCTPAPTAGPDLSDNVRNLISGHVFKTSHQPNSVATFTAALWYPIGWLVVATLIRDANKCRGGDLAGVHKTQEVVESCPHPCPSSFLIAS
jgi:hypothetical protein